MCVLVGTLIIHTQMILDQVVIVIGCILVPQPGNGNLFLLVRLLNDSVPNDNFISSLLKVG